MRPIHFEVPTKPKGQPRHRSTVIRRRGGAVATNANGRPMIRQYDPKESVEYKAVIRSFAESAMEGEGPFEGPVSMLVIATFELPKSKHRKRTIPPAIPHTAKPDGDNILKAVKDACSGVVYQDDAQVYCERIIKRVGAQGEAASIKVAFKPLEGQQTPLHVERPDEAMQEFLGCV